MKNCFFIILLSVVFFVYIPMNIFSQDTQDLEAGTINTNEDDLFGGGQVVTDIPEAEASEKEQTLVETKTLDIGGRFISTMTARGTWWSLLHETAEIVSPDEQQLLLYLGLDLFLDARPDEHFRVLAKANILYPFNLSESFTLRNPSENLKIKEMFADTDINNIVFLRAGKQTVKWGVGYFFSPADVINLIPIDPENPNADREGPVAIKAQVPVETTNLYLYILDYNIAKPEDLAVAGKVEFVVGNIETTAGLFYKKDSSPKGMAAVTYPFGDFSLFGEGVLSYGSNKTFVRKNGPMLETFTDSANLYTSCTAGLTWQRADDNFMASVQYYYNGEGYAEDGFIRDNFQNLMMLTGTGALAVSDLAGMSMHYGAGMASFSSLFGSDFGLSLFWMGSLTDFSGQVRPSLTWKPTDYTNFSLTVPLFYGDEHDEYSPKGAGISIEFAATIGGGSF